MTAEPDVEFKIPPQFIDSSILTLDGIGNPRIGSGLGLINGLFVFGPWRCVHSIEMLGIEIAFESTLHVSDGGYTINVRTISLIDDFLVRNTNFTNNADDKFTMIECQELLNKMKSNPILKYFISDVFEYVFIHKFGYRDSSKPQGFDRESLDKLVPKLTAFRFTKIISYLLKQGEGNLCIDFWKLYSLYWKINNRTGNRIIQPKQILKQLLTKYNGIEVWSDKSGNLVLFLGEKLRNHIIDTEMSNIQLTKKVIDRQGFLFMRKSQTTFLSLYRKYIRAMSSILSFTNCAGNRTRTAKLFAPELKFFFDKSMEESSKRRRDFFEKSRITMAQLNRKNIELKDVINSPIESYRRAGTGTILKSKVIKNLEREIEKLNFEKKSLEYAKKYNTKIYKKSYEAGYLGSHSTTNENNGVDFSKVIDFHIESGMSVIPMVISGDAGMGKTTVMAQCSLGYFSKLEDKLDNFLSRGEDLPSLPLPVVLKAKRYPSPSLPKFIVDSNPELLNHLSFEEIMQLFDTWSSMKNLHNSSMVFFIDGVDECATKKDAKSMIAKLKSGTQASNDKPVLVLATRPSHEDIVVESLSKFSICRMQKGIGEFYSENELSEKMPLMLCDAWGLTRESGEKLSEIFATYQDTLVHPLFVGWFCFLILEGKLEEIEDSSNVVEISQNNLIKTIIEIGVEKSLARRESYIGDTIKNNQTTAEEFSKLLEMFVSIAFHYNISKPSKVFTKMQQLGFVKSVSEEIKNSIKNDCGILFLTGDNIEWTHTTIPEIMYADFYFKNDLSVNLGPIRVSEPVISRMAQLHYENGDFESYASAELYLKHKLLPIQDFVEFLAYEMFDLHQDSSDARVEPILCVNDSKLSPVTNRKMLDIELQVAKLYIDSLGTRKQFALSKDYIVSKDLNDAISLVYQHSNNPFCTDTINPIHFENVLGIDQINPAKVSADTRIADCFSYYRNLLLSHTDKDLRVDHPVLQMHKRADNFEGIFDIGTVNAMTRYELDDILSSWIEHETPQDWYKERESLISNITREYVFTAYEKLFGEGNDETCTDIIYDTLENTTVHIVTDTENGVVESTNILTWLLGKHGLNGFIDIGTGLPSGILDEYAMNELVERQLVLVPFVYECLELIKKQKSGKGSAPTEFESFVNEFAEQNNGYWEPFELVKAYASNLD